ncbi:MAG: hypothetical protein GX591_03990 [Planctomycetes bacterium]|jgi:hypothetical protein|nr:hypothetical protein [Planctomycetota bacterium]
MAWAAFLLGYLTTIARQGGVKRFFAKVLPTNKAMLNIFYNSGYPVHAEFGGEACSIYHDIA